MRIPLSALTMVVFTAPALAQFPPPGIYTCFAADGSKLGSLSLLVAGDYEWLSAYLSGGARVGGKKATASTGGLKALPASGIKESGSIVVVRPK